MIDLAHKIPELDAKLIQLLEQLNDQDWNKQTIARLWKVRDVVAHLLDGNIRTLSGLRDEHQADTPEIHTYQDLVNYLNQLNADWVQAMKRVSPEVLLDLFKYSCPPFHEYYASLDPYDKATYAVAWAGESESKNWMHIAREYTERFLHQQQVRDAIGQEGIMNREFYYPFLQVCMYALPHTLRDTRADTGVVLKMTITGDAGGSWFVQFNGNKWELLNEPMPEFETEVTIEADASWKLFSKSLRPKHLRAQIDISGNQSLGEAALEMVSFMA